MTIAVVPNTRTSWYDPELSAGEPVVIQNINYATGDNNSVMNTVIRYLQDVEKRWSATSVRSGLGLTGQGTGTINVASGYAIIDGRHIYNDAIDTVDISLEGDGDYYIVATLTQDSETQNRDPENDSIALSAIAVGSFTASSEKLVLGKITVASSVATVVTSYAQTSEVRVGSLMPPQNPDGSSLSSIKIFTGETEKTEIARFTGSTLKYFDDVKARFGDDDDADIYFNSGFGRLQFDVPSNGAYFNGNIQVKSDLRFENNSGWGSASNGFTFGVDGANDFFIKDEQLNSTVIKITNNTGGSILNPIDGGVSNGGYFTGAGNDLRLYDNGSDSYLDAINHNLNFQTASEYRFLTSGGAKLITINQLGNIGFNTSDIKWGTTLKAIEGYQSSLAFHQSAPNIYLASNVYYNSGFKYAENDLEATLLSIEAGRMYLRMADDSGALGEDTAITFGNALDFNWNAGSPTFVVFNPTETGTMTINGILTMAGDLNLDANDIYSTSRASRLSIGSAIDDEKGFILNPDFTTGTGSKYGFDIAGKITDINSNIGNAFGFQVGLEYDDAGNVLTNYYGMNVQDVTVTNGTVTNAYGLYINSIDNASTLNYAIYTNSGISRFGDDVLVEIADDTIHGFGEGLHVGNSTYGLSIGQNTGAGYAPLISTLSKDSNDISMLFVNKIEIADDTGTTPVTKFIMRQEDDTPITTRPLFSIYNDTTELFTVDKDGNITVAGTVDGVDIASIHADGWISVPLYPNFRNIGGWSFNSTDDYVDTPLDATLDECVVYLPLSSRTTSIRVRYEIIAAAVSSNTTGEIDFTLEYVDDGVGWTTEATSNDNVTDDTGVGNTSKTATRTIAITPDNDAGRHYRLKIAKSRSSGDGTVKATLYAVQINNF